MSATIDEIKDRQKPGHDTIYCSPRTKQRLLDSVQGVVRGMTADNLQIAGLRVESHKCFDRTILCQKGTVFPLAKDYHDD